MFDLLTVEKISFYTIPNLMALDPDLIDFQLCCLQNNNNNRTTFYLQALCKNVLRVTNRNV